MLDGMTNIKASEVLKELKYYTEDLPPYSPDEVAEALDMAIQALEAQPTHGSTYGGVSWGGTYRDATEEERKSVKDYVESISRPTGVRFDTQPTDAKETIIKSTLKHLVKMQIEEGSVGFAVDNDPDHDCCWDDVLAWIEAQPSEEDFVKHKKEVLERIAKREREIDKYIKELETLKQQPCEDCISREYIEPIVEELENICINGDERVLSMLADIKNAPSVKPKYTDEEIDKAQAVEQAYVDKMVELAVEEIKERYSDAIGKMKKAIDEMTEIHSDGEFYIKNVDAKWIISKYLCGAKMKEANDG